MNDITRVLDAVSQGNPQAASQLLPLVYDELRKLATQRMAHEKPGQTLQATALVHEAYLRLVASPEREREEAEPYWNSRGHFFAAAAEAMRRILIERARRRHRVRHGGAVSRVDLDQLNVAEADSEDELLALNECLDQLAAEDEIVANVVKLRYFAGLTIEETAEALKISVRTANRHWAYARAWLYQRLS